MARSTKKSKESDPDDGRGATEKAAAVTDFYNALVQAINKACARGVERNQVAVLLCDFGTFLEEGELLAERIEHARMARHGRRFRGRRKQSYGPIKGQIAKLLKKNPTMTNRKLEAALELAGCEIYDDRRADGETFIEYRNCGLGYKRFIQAASEVRNDLKAAKAGRKIRG